MTLSRRGSPLGGGVWLSWVLAAGLWSACHHQASSVDPASSRRFLVQDPEEIRDAAFAVASEPVHAWRFAGAAEWAPWRATAESRGPRATVALEYDQPLATDGIDVIQVDLAGEAGPVTATFSWQQAASGADQVYTLRTRCAASHRLHRCEAALREQPGWTSTVSLLRVSLNARAEDVVVREIRLLRQKASVEQIGQAMQDGVKIDLGGDLRNALLGLPGAPIERTVRVPPDSRLRFAYGRPSFSLSSAVHLRVLVGADRPAFETTLTNRDAPGWREAEIDLGDFAGQEIRVRLEVIADTPSAVAYWGHPELVSVARKTPPNIVLISIDTLRPDRLSLYGHSRSTSPRLDRWAHERAVVFRTAVAQAPWTLPSHASMFTGLNPNRHHTNMSDPVARSLTMLPEILRDAGYTTLAVTGGAFLHPQYGFAQGFDRYHYANTPPHLDEGGRELEEGIAKAMQWLEQHKGEPFFLFFHTYEVHDPYRPRQPYFGHFTDQPPITVPLPTRSETPEGGFRIHRTFSSVAAQDALAGLSPADVEELVSAAYDSGIAYTDQQIGVLLDRLGEWGLDDNTIVILTSDHGETLGEHDSVGHLDLYEENILVPLIIAAPDGRGAGREVSDQVRSIDVLPTILDLAGLPPLGGIDGRSLVPLIEGRRADVPPEAVTYGARWNAGISLRYGNRFRYVYNDSVWSPIAGDETIDSLRPDTGDEVDLAARIPGFRDRLEEIFFDDLPGVGIRFQNPTASSFYGAFSGWPNPYGIKSMNLDCDCFELDGEAVRFHVPPGEAFTIVLLARRQDVDLGLTLDGQAEDGAPWSYRGRVSLAQIDAGHHLALLPAGWQSVPSGEGATAAGSSVSFWWQGDKRSSASGLGEIDPELRARLRALGYVGEASKP